MPTRFFSYQTVSPAILFFCSILCAFSFAARAAAENGINDISPQTPPFFCEPGKYLDGFRVLGPFTLLEDQPATAGIRAVLGTVPAAVPPDGLFWCGRHPRTWFSAKTDASERLRLREILGASKLAEHPPDAGKQQGTFAYLHRRIQSSRRERVFLSIESPGPLRVWVNGSFPDAAAGSGKSLSAFGEKGWWGQVQLREGLNDLLIESRAPVEHASWFVRAKILSPSEMQVSRKNTQNLDRPQESRKAVLERSQSFLKDHPAPGRQTRWPAGWLRLTTPLPHRENIRISYNLFLPKEMTDAASSFPLAVLAPPSEEDAFYPARRMAMLDEEARKRGWILAVPEPPSPFPAGPAPAFFSWKDAVEGARLDATTRLPVNPQRICLVELREGGHWEESPGGPYYAGIVRLDPEEENAARRLFSRLEVFFLDPHPARVEIAARFPGEARAAWASVRRAQNWMEPVRLRVEVAAENYIVAAAENVLQFDLALRDMPNIQNGTVVIEIDGNKRKVIDRVIPEAISLRCVSREEGMHWTIQQTASTQPVSRVLLGQIGGDLPAWSTPERPGVSALLACAVRTATDAAVAVLPARAARFGHPAGLLFLSDLEGLCADVADSAVATYSIPAVALIHALERDYAGPREFVTDGLKAVLNTGADGIDGGDEETKTLDGETKERIFLSTALDNAGPIIRVAGLKDHLETLVEQLGGGEAILEQDSRKTAWKDADNDEENADLTLRKALMILLEAEPIWNPPPPDIRMLPDKTAGTVKNPIGRK